MSVVIFTGPTLSADEAGRELEAEYCPPAAQGDVFRAVRKRPRAIGIIDGYFERVPSVWHKEILWAMSHGIHVFGSASMGALRAAELAAFGMEGVGSIFEAYRDGTLEDDDDVAVVHGPIEFEFRPGSEAMVDIRYTLDRAVEGHVLTAAAAVVMESAAKSMFYADRSYPRILREAAILGVLKAELGTFREWLATGRSSLKRLDALAMLRLIRDRIASGLEPKHVAYTFENTSMWESAWRLSGDGHEPDTPLPDAVLEELRIEGQAYLQVKQAAFLRCLAVKHSYVQGLAETDGHAQLAAQRFWRRQRVDGDDGRRQWMVANQVDDAQLASLLDDNARLDWMKSLAALDARGYMIDQLRVTGDYPRLLARARAKSAALALLGLEDAALDDIGFDREALLRWYFDERLGRGHPDDLDEYSRDLGYSGVGALQRAIVREFCYLKGRPVRPETAG